MVKKFYNTVNRLRSFLSSCHPVIWSSSHLVIHSLIHQVIRLSCNNVIQSSCYPVILLSCHPVILSSSCHLDVWSFGQPVIWSSGHLVIWSSDHPVIKSSCHFQHCYKRMNNIRTSMSASQTTSRKCKFLDHGSDQLLSNFLYHASVLCSLKKSFFKIQNNTNVRNYIKTICNIRAKPVVLTIM